MFKTLIILFFSPVVIFAEANIAPKVEVSNLWDTCTPCHGSDGNSKDNPTIPKIAGQYNNYLYTQLKNFAQGEKGVRDNPLMYPIAEALSEKEMTILSDYFSKQKYEYLEAENRSDIKVGQRIYKGGILDKKIIACSACHGPSGQGNEPGNIPKIGGQHAEYLATQLKSYREGTRSHGMMTRISQKLSDQEIDAVSNYLQGLRN